MDPKMIEMNNLRVLNDYLNQTIDVLARQPRLGQSGPAGLGFSPFAPIPTTAGLGTDTVYGPWLGSPMLQHTPFGGALPFTGNPMYGAADPFFAQRNFGQASYGPTSYGPTSFSPTSFSPTSYGPASFSPANYGPGFAPGFGPAGFGGWQQPWSPISEVTRQAQLNQALAARQSVLEAMCRACGIPV